MGSLQRELEHSLKLVQEGKYSEAETMLGKTLVEAPDSLECLNMLTFVSSRLGKYVEAAEHAKRAIELAPDNPSLRANFSLVLVFLKMFDKAEKQARIALELDPDQPIVFDFLGQALIGLNRPKEAYEALKVAHQSFPEDSRITYRLGTSLAMMGEYEKAEEEFRNALKIKPQDADVLTNLGVCLRYQGKYKEALVCFQKAIHVDPHHSAAHLNRGSSWLLFGNYVQGWPEFTYRFLTHQVITEKFRAPLWDGTSFVGKKVLLYSEQGFGDTIQFIRYAPLVKELGGDVYVECPMALIRWLKNHPGIDRLVPQGQPHPEHDFQAPLMSLPSILKTTLENIPQVINPMPVVLERPNVSEKMRVGIVWAGNASHSDDRRRSCSLEEFKGLLSLKDVTLISLQKGGVSPLPEGIEDGVKDCLDFVDTAQVMQTLDLVITVDTSVAHLSATLGKPTWLLLGIPNDWRWMLDREDSPWYPSVRIFRQKTIGDWKPVFKTIRDELEKFKLTSKA